MGTEIERKFLVIGDAWRQGASEGLPIRQGYIAAGLSEVVAGLPTAPPPRPRAPRGLQNPSPPVTPDAIRVGPCSSVSVRVRVAGNRAFLNVKAPAHNLVVRTDFEYEIPLKDAEALLDTCCTGHVIEKTRYTVEYAGLTWEIDEFHGLNAGLLVVEVELTHEHQPFDKPPWAGQDLSHNPRYLNSSLALRPYSQW